MTAFNPDLAARIAATGIPLSADMADREPRTLSERAAYSLRLEEDVRQIVARQRACQILAEAAKHTASPSDHLAYDLDAWLITHPKAPVSTDADYDGWAEHIAARQDEMNRARKEATA